MNALTNPDRRLRRIVEVPVAAVLHPDLQLVARRLAHSMLNAIARKPTADGAGNRCQNTTASSADLISQGGRGNGYHSIGAARPASGSTDVHSENRPQGHGEDRAKGGAQVLAFRISNRD